MDIVGKCVQDNMARQRAARLARDAALSKVTTVLKRRATVSLDGRSQADHMRGYLQTLENLTADEGAILYEGDSADGLPRDMSQTCSKLVKDGELKVVGIGTSRFGQPASIYGLV